MKRVVVERYRDMDFSRGKRGQVIDNALLEHIQRRSTLDAVRQVGREALAPYGGTRETQVARRRKRPKR